MFIFSDCLRDTVWNKCFNLTNINSIYFPESTKLENKDNKYHVAFGTY